MKRNTKKAVTVPTVDYTPEEVRAARDLAVKAGRAYKAHAVKGETTLLAQCVEATRESVRVGFLVDGRNATPGVTMSGKDYAALFGLSASSEVTFWTTLGYALDAGVTIGDDLWKRLATRSGEHGKLLAKRAEVRKVIRDGGSLADIVAVCDQVVKAAASRAANTPASEKDAGKGESPEAGITPSADPVADAHLAIVGLDAALKRIENDDAGREAWKAIKAQLAAIARRETTLRKAQAADKAA